MTFRNDACDAFLELFETYKNQIRGAEGCEYLELLRERPDSNVFFTYSHWREDKYLQQYRESETFAVVWPKTKAMFAAPAETWSTEAIAILK
jgi:(4S)-4-hydroxy-5-phosphonooxypentane-2,3-dione isomerase